MEYTDKEIDCLNRILTDLPIKRCTECLSHNTLQLQDTTQLYLERDLARSRQNRIDSISHAKAVLKYIIDTTGIVDKFILHSTGRPATRSNIVGSTAESCDRVRSELCSESRDEVTRSRL